MQRLLIILLLLCSSQAFSQVTLRAHYATLGKGLELGYRWENKWAIRAGMMNGSYKDLNVKADDTDGTAGNELQYDVDIDFDNQYYFADWHPWNKRFRITVGFVNNDSSGKIVTRCEAQSPLPGFPASCEFGNGTYQTLFLGDIITDIDFEPFSPYLGIGWGHKTESGFAFNADIGVALLGDANVRMTSTGSCNTDETCRNEINSEARELEDEINDYGYAPLISLGLSYQFQL